MERIYTKRWVRGTGKPLAPYTLDEAKKLHTSRKPYTVALEEEGKPIAFIELNAAFVYVGFLDERRRETGGYEFTELETGKLFLKEVRQWEYQEETFQKLNSRTFRFAPDGEFGLRKRDNLTRKSEKVLFDYKFPITDVFYEEYPAFGDYSNLLIKREIPELDSL